MLTTRKEIEGHPVYLFHFDSPAEFGRTCAAEKIDNGYGERASWYGNETREQSLIRCQQGHDKLVKDAQAIIDKIDSAGIELERTHYAPSVAGAYAVVGDFLAGNPQCMRRRVAEVSDRAPVRIYVDGTSSGGIDARDLHKRGVAVLAFVMALSAERPVELYTLTALDAERYGHGYGAVCVRIPSAPLELATACFALTSQGYTRRLGYGYLTKHAGSCGGWGWGAAPAVNGKYERLTRLALDMAPTDVFMSATFIDDSLLRDPVTWVNRMLHSYRTELQDAA